MAATGELKERIQLLQAAKARAEALGKKLKPEAQAELDSYAEQGLLGSSAAGAAGGKVTEGERKTAFLATRLAGAVQQINAAGKNAQTPGFASLFGGTNNVVGNFLTGSDRQRVENAQLDLLDSALTLGTGAAYTKEQLQGYRQSYFPQIGDSDATVADKKSRLALALQAARIGAGGAAPQIDKALEAAGFAAPANKEGGDPVSGTAGVAADGSGAPPSGPSPTGGGTAPPGTELKFNDELPPEVKNAVHLTPEQEASIVAVAQNGGSPDQINAILRSFGLQTTAEEAAQVARIYADPKNRGRPLAINVDNSIKPVDAGDGALGAAVRGAGNALTFGFMDEAGALADTATMGLTYDQALNRRRGMEAFDDQQHGVARGVGQVVGALPVGGIEFAGARAAARAAGVAALRSGIGREAAMMAANRTLAARTAADAAVQGGAYGFGNTDGGLLDRAGGAALGAGAGALAGGTLAYGGARAGQALAARARVTAPALTDQQLALQAADRQGIVPFAPDLGAAGTRRATTVASQSIAGAQPIVAGARRTVDSAEAVRNRVAATIGQAVNSEAAGETARTGAQAFIARTGQRIGRIYDAASAAAGQARVATPEALRVLNQELPALAESPVRGPGVGILEGLQQSLQQPQTVRGLRNMRTLLRDEFESAGLRGSNIERIAGRVVDAATDDIVAGLRAQGLDRAATQYRVADRMWRERLTTIDDHLTPILGDADGASAKSGEQIVKALQGAMQGNNRRFAGFVQALPAHEQGVVRASLIQRLGRATKGNQDQDGEVFSLATFLTNWDDIGDRAKNTLFGAEGRAALNDLATYANQAKQAQKYANHSNSGGAIGNLLTGATGLVGLKTLGTNLALQYGAGRLLASPRFARWLARPPRNPNPAAARAHIARLTRIARAEPAIANDVLALQQRLADAFGGMPTRLAADEGNARSDVVNGQQRKEQPPRTGAQP